MKEEIRNYINLLEAASLIIEKPEDLFRKIDALDAIIAPNSGATQHEKENAERLKKILLNRLKTEYPNAKPPPKSTQTPQTTSSSYGSWNANFWADMVAAAEKEKKRNNRRRKPMTLGDMLYGDTKYTEKEVMPYVTQLRMERGHLSQGWGNVEHNERYKELTNKIDTLLRKHCPKEYAKVLAHRKKS